MLLKTKDREKLTRLEPGMFMKTNEIVELTRNANNSLIFYNIRVVAGSPRGGTWNVYENKRDSRANLECYRK